MAVELRLRETIQDLAAEKSDEQVAMSALREPCARHVSSVTNTTSVALAPPFNLSNDNKGDDGGAIEAARMARDSSESDARAADLDLYLASDSSSCFSYEDGVDDFDGPLWLDAMSAESVAREAGLTSRAPNLAPQVSDADGLEEALTKQATQRHEAFDLSSPGIAASCQRTDETVAERQSDGKRWRGRDRSIDAVIRSSSITDNIPYPGKDLIVQAHNIDHAPHKRSILCDGRHVGQCPHVAGCKHGPYSSA